METFNSELVSTYLNGSASEAQFMVKLMAQVIAVLFTGIVLWRVSAIFGKKNKKRSKTIFSESRFQQHWKK